MSKFKVGDKVRVVVSDEYFVPPMSYGYVTQEPIKGCTDPAAVNYNPDAVENDLSCLYIKECYRKRWLFSSLGCKPVKTNCNCK